MEYDYDERTYYEEDEDPDPAGVIKIVKQFDLYWIAQLIDLINENSAKLGFKAVPNDR